MRNRQVDITEFNGEFQIRCYKDGEQCYAFGTLNPLAIGFIAQVFLTKDQCPSEEYMSTIVEDILT